VDDLPMTELLQKAIAKVSKLSDEQQIGSDTVVRLDDVFPIGQ
jgi:hypothetical protein